MGARQPDVGFVDLIHVLDARRPAGELGPPPTRGESDDRRGARRGDPPRARAASAGDLGRPEEPTIEGTLEKSQRRRAVPGERVWAVFVSRNRRAGRPLESVRSPSALAVKARIPLLRRSGTGYQASAMRVGRVDLGSIRSIRTGLAKPFSSDRRERKDGRTHPQHLRKSVGHLRDRSALAPHLRRARLPARPEPACLARSGAQGPDQRHPGCGARPARAAARLHLCNGRGASRGPPRARSKGGQRHRDDLPARRAPTAGSRPTRRGPAAPLRRAAHRGPFPGRRPGEVRRGLASERRHPAPALGARDRGRARVADADRRDLHRHAQRDHRHRGGAVGGGRNHPGSSGCCCYSSLRSAA